MYVLVTYDVSTAAPGGKGRLRAVAKACENRGQRVQASVFEMKLDPAAWAALRAELLGLIEPATDSLRFYRLGRNWRDKVEHHGADPGYDVDGPLIV